MKVQSTSSSPVYGITGGTRTDKHISAESSNSKSNSPAVDLSPAARQLAALNNPDGDVRTELVQQLRDALASGDLTINPDRIAEGLIDSVREMLK